MRTRSDLAHWFFMAFGRNLLVCCLLILGSIFFVAGRHSYAQTGLVGVCDAQDILFVVGSQGIIDRDLVLIDRLREGGDHVVVRSDVAVTVDDTVGLDLVIISESVLSTNIGPRLREISVPILTWEAYLYPYLGMTGTSEGEDYGEIVGKKEIEIVERDHPLAGRLKGKIKTTKNGENHFHWGSPGDQAIVIAQMRTHPPRAAIFAYEQGATMVDLVAPARRVGFHSAYGPDLTEDGWTLFMAAVNWAAACTPTPTATATATATDSPTPTNTSRPPDTPTAISTPTPTNTQSLPPPATATATLLPTGTAMPTNSPPPPSVIPTFTAPPEATPTASPSPSATPTVTGEAQLSISKTDFLFIDADQNNAVSSGDTLLYEIRVLNSGMGTAPPVRLEDRPDANTRLVVGSVRTIGGVIGQGNGTGDTQVVTDISPLLQGAYAIVTLRVLIEPQAGVISLQNQAIVTPLDGSGQPTGQTPLVSDDPATTDISDPTVTLLGESLVQSEKKLFLPLISKS
jgi:uncharacterized repeat protein (TIGR01451 family)